MASWGGLKERNFKSGPLNKVKISQQKTLWQSINIFFPVAMIILLGVSAICFQKKKIMKKGTGAQENWLHQVNFNTIKFNY